MGRRIESGGSGGRRTFIKTVGAAGALGLTGLAGCSGGGDGGDGGGDGEDGGDGSGDGGGGSTTTTTDELEDELVIYSPVPRDMISWFEEETGVSVELVTGAGPQTTARFFSEQESGQYNADMMYGPTSTYLPNPDSVLEHTIPITDFDVDRQAVMPDELYDKWESKMPGDVFAHMLPDNTLTHRVFAYSTDLDEPPTSYDDLLEERFHDNIVAQPFFMDTYAQILIRALGSVEATEEYYRGLKDQNLLIQIAELNPILEGRATVSFLATDTSGSMTRMDQGAPIDVTMPEEGVAYTGSAYVVAENAPHPNAAQKFLEMQLSEEGQKYIQSIKGGRDPISPDIPHGNERMRELIEEHDPSPMMLTAEEIQQGAEITKRVWPDVSV